MNWNETAASVPWNIRPFVDGRYRESVSTQLVDNINPADETTLSQFASGDPADIDQAVRVARRSFDDGRWSEIPAARRAAILFKLADLIVLHKDELALLDSLEMGKPIQAALYDAEHTAPALARSWAGFCDKLNGESAPLGRDTLAFNCYEPRGVVAGITPWNFPCVNAVYKVGPALAAGNTIVLKPSELSPSSALRLAEIALEAGIPEGVFNVVPGLGSTVGAALAMHPEVDFLSFTGSTTTGRKLMELSGRSNGKPVLLECGGKSPQVVFDDVQDLDRVAEAIVQSVLWNQGQVCSAHTRLVVHSRIKDALLTKIMAKASQTQPGDPLDPQTTFGPLASPAQRDRVKKYVDEGIRSGAVPILQGSIQETGGCYVSPTIFDRVQPTMTIVREEIFGPVLCVQEFETEAEAIALANGTDFGLVATVWTRDMGRGKRVAHAIKAGYLVVRTSGPESAGSGYALSYEPQRASGFGPEIGLQGLQSYSTLKFFSFTGS
jgi:acyl-CoA reductase-like NAD-dependent aldehyde dehydrogenase